MGPSDRVVALRRPRATARLAAVALVVWSLSGTARAETYTWTFPGPFTWYCDLCWGHGFLNLAAGTPPNDPSSVAVVPAGLVTSYVIDVTNTQSVSIGELRQLANFIDVMGGQFHANTILIGADEIGDAAVQFKQYNFLGGKSVVTAGQLLEVSKRGAAGATFDIGSGTLAAPAQIVGNLGKGVLIHSGGSNDVAGVLWLGKGSSGNGSYAMEVDINFTDKPKLTANIEYVGFDGTGSFLQRTGTNTVGDTLALGVGAYGQGSYSLLGGTLKAGTQIVAYAGTGNFTQSGGANIATGTLYVGATGGSHGSYVQSGGTNNVGTLRLGHNEFSIGSYTLSGGDLRVSGPLYVGNDGQGSFLQTAGNIYASGGIALGTASTGRGTFKQQLFGNIDSSQAIVGYDGIGSFEQAGWHHVAGTLWIGVNGGSQGSYRQTDGLLSIGRSGGELRLADQAGSQGVFVLDGGVLQVDRISTGAGTSYLDLNGGSFTDVYVPTLPSGTRQDIGVTFLTVGAAAASNGTLDLFGSARTMDTRVGFSGTGTVNQTAGTHTVAGDLSLGRNAAGVGNYKLTGGVLTAGKEYIGFDGTGSFIQAAGGNTTPTLALGAGAKGRGSYALRGGTLNSDETIVGYSGAGTFIHEGGTATVAGTLYLGVNAASTGNYTQSAGVNTVGKLDLGAFGSGTYTLDGGRLSVGSIVGGNGKNGAGFGQLVLNGGQLDLNPSSTVALGGLKLAGSTGSSFDLRLAAGQTLSVLNEVIGGSGNGRIVQDGGTHDVAGALVLGIEANSTGTYQLNAGVLKLPLGAAVGAGVGTLVVDGGTLNASDLVRVTTLNVGSTASATGSFLIADGLSVIARTEYIGPVGRGHYVQDGGANRVNELIVGPRGSLEKTGGSLEVLTIFQNQGDSKLRGVENTFYGVFSNEGQLSLESASVLIWGAYSGGGRLVGKDVRLEVRDVTIAADGYWALGPGVDITTSGNFRNASTQGALWKTDSAALTIVSPDDKSDAERSASNEFSLAGADLGAVQAGYANNFSWYQLTLAPYTSLSLVDGNSTPGAALYVRVLTLSEGIGQLGEVLSDYNIYYDPTQVENAYLNAGTYALGGSGHLIPAQAVPEPGLATLFGGGLAAMLGLSRRRHAIRPQ